MERQYELVCCLLNGAFSMTWNESKGTLLFDVECLRNRHTEMEY